MKKIFYFLSFVTLFVCNSAFTTVAPQANADGCDKIKLRSGEIISAKEVVMGTNEVSYKKCDDTAGIVFTVTKKDITGIDYASGKSSVFNAETSSAIPKNKKTRTKAHAMALASLLIGIASLFIPLFVLAMAMGITAFVLGIMAYKMVSKQPEGSGDATMAIIGLIFGAITCCVMFLLAAAGKVKWSV
jgi:hypothetical protein